MFLFVRVLGCVLEPARQEYEKFITLHESILYSVAQCSDHALLLDTTPPGPEQDRVAAELADMRQNCRDMISEYNADAARMSRSVLKSESLPERLDVDLCTDRGLE